VLDALRLYLRLASVGLRSQMQYRGAFLFRSIVDFGVMVSDLGPVWVLSRYFGHLDGWSFAELALLYGMVGSSWASVELGLRGFESFSAFLLRGDLDRLLLRPRSVVLQIAALEFEARKVARLGQALLVLTLACVSLRLGPVSLAFVNYFPALAALGRTESAGWPSALPWLSPLACSAVLCAGFFAFGRGLRRYESAGS